jgi:hypothetical protein
MKRNIFVRPLKCREGCFITSLIYLNRPNARIDYDDKLMEEEQIRLKGQSVWQRTGGLASYQCVFCSDRLTSGKMFLIGTDIFIIEMVIDFNYV